MSISNLVLRQCNILVKPFSRAGEVFETPDFKFEGKKFQSWLRKIPRGQLHHMKILLKSVHFNDQSLGITRRIFVAASCAISFREAAFLLVSTSRERTLGTSHVSCHALHGARTLKKKCRSLEEYCAGEVVIFLCKD